MNNMCILNDYINYAKCSVNGSLLHQPQPLLYLYFIALAILEAFCFVFPFERATYPKFEGLCTCYTIWTHPSALSHILVAYWLLIIFRSLSTACPQGRPFLSARLGFYVTITLEECFSQSQNLLLWVTIWLTAILSTIPVFAHIISLEIAQQPIK